MNNLKPYLIFVFLSLFVQSVYAQDQDYIITDSAIIYGVKLMGRTPRFNSQFILLKDKSNAEVRYTPDELKGYGFKDGTKYVTTRITVDGQEKTVFLEHLAEGKINLYRYVDKNHKIFFIRKDSSGLIELKKDKKAFAEVSGDCRYVSDDVKLATYNKRSLKKLTDNYNHCRKTPLPYFKYGVYFGYGQTGINKPSGYFNPAIEDISFSPSNSFVIGLFADIPIAMSSFSFNTGVYFTKNGYTANAKSTQSDVDAVVNLTSVHLPLLFRYTVPTRKVRPFFNLGGRFTFNAQNTSAIYKSSFQENTIFISTPIKEKLVSDFLIGYVAGAGIQFNVNYKKTISAEFRYASSTGGDNTLNMRGFDVIISFSF